MLLFSHSVVSNSVTLWTVAPQASQSFTISWRWCVNFRLISLWKVQFFPL